MSEKLCPTHKIKEYRPECQRCHGEGLIEDDDDLLLFRPNFARCFGCGGSGIAPYSICELCEQDALDELHSEEYA